ncbi:MAG TPA: hypothetical protein VF624_04745 [Tepidisphaeraceae bacterium]|jgi:hypothetical protein
MKRQIAVLVALLIAGCTRDSRPATTVVHAVDQWPAGSVEGARVFRTATYAIHTTLADDEPVLRMATLLESATARYAALTCVAPRTGRPLPVYYFATYDQWADYTRRTTGPMADVYLRVFNGGYAIGERVVCWHGSGADVLSTIAHEGFHQYVARHFARRLPPVIEEGMAVACENVRGGGTDIGDEPVPRRVAALAAAVADGYLIPLDTLLLLHAGDLSDRPDALREGFYAQCWALATFLQSTPAYRDGFRRMLADVAAGTAAIDLGANREGATYNAGLIRPLLQKYVVREWATLEMEFTRWQRELAARHASLPAPE